jgi:biotin transport system substrate-specific component
MSTNTAVLRPTLVPRLGVARDVLLVAAGAGLISLAAQISIPLPFTPVPVTGQTFAVLLVGAGLGSIRGASAAALYLLLGIAGLPVYAHGTHGVSTVTGATGGYLIGFVVAAGLTGLLAERRWDRRFSSAVSAMLTGNVVVYLVALPWLAASLGTGLDRTLELGLYPFVPGDLLKLYLAGAVLPGAWRLLGRR